MSKIAVLIDSGTDVPQEYVDKYGMYLLPLTIMYGDKVYHDRIDISSEEVLERLENEIPTTSLPSIGDTHELIEKIYNDGFRELIVVTISSGLSGTFIMLSIAAQ